MEVCKHRLCLILTCPVANCTAPPDFHPCNVISIISSVLRLLSAFCNSYGEKSDCTNDPLEQVGLGSCTV